MRFIHIFVACACFSAALCKPSLEQELLEAENEVGNGFCDDKQDGNYPNPSDRHTYFACSGSVRYTLKCPSSLCYYQKGDSCNFCTVSEAPVTATTASPRPTPPAGSCNGKQIGNYPNPNDKHSYIACDGGSGHVMPCPTNLCFDATANACDYCSSKREAVTEDVRPTPRDGFCNGKKGNYMNPDDRHSYVACDGGRGYVMPCPARLCYDQDKDRCEYCTPVTAPPPKTTVSPTTAGPTPPDGFCNGKQHGNYVNPDDKHSYIACDGGPGHVMPCPAKLCYNAKKDWCDWCGKTGGSSSTAQPTTTGVVPSPRPTPPNGFCNGKQHGNYVNPDDKHSYIACDGGPGHVMPCPAKLCYNAKKDWCDWCGKTGGSSSTAQPTTTGVEPSPRPTPPNGFCNGKQHGNYVNPDDKHSYIACDGGPGYVMPCPAKLCYDAKKDWCDYCTSKREVLVAEVRPTPRDGFCNGKKGNYMNPDDRHSYIACDGGRGYVMPCPARLCYDQDKDRCEYCTPVTAPPPKTTVSPTTAGPTPPDGFCNGKQHGNYVNPDDKHSYIACDGGPGHVMPCPAKLCYNAKKDWCDWCGKTGGSSSTAQPTTTGVEPSPRPTPPNGFCNGKQHGNYVNPDDKHSYIACDGGPGHVMPCPAKLCYNAKKDWCDWCGKTGGSSSTAQPTTTGVVPSPRPTPPKGFCKGKKPGDYTNPNDKHSFIACSGDRGWVVQCPAKLCFDEPHDRCDYCNPATAQPKTTVSSRTTRPTPSSEFCTGKKNGNYVNVADRYTFIICSNGLPYLMDCPSRLCYDSKADRCLNCGNAKREALSFCDGKTNGNYANPKDKHTYVSCVAGVPYVRQCPGNLCYREQGDQCDWCSVATEVPSTTAATTKAVATAPPGFCDARSNKNYANPLDEHSFITCFHHIGYVQTCPVDLCYEEKEDKCNYCSKE